MSSLLLSRLSKLSLRKQPTLGVVISHSLVFFFYTCLFFFVFFLMSDFTLQRHLVGARFLSETPLCHIYGVEHCGYSQAHYGRPRYPQIGRLMITDFTGPSCWTKVLEKTVRMDLMSETGTMGASHGWAFTLRYGGIPHLVDDLNPGVSNSDGCEISLPDLVTLPHCQTQLVTNVAMSSSSPEDDDCIVAVKFVGPQLSLCRPAEKSKKWVNIRIEDPGFFNSRVMYSKRDKMFSMLDCVGTHIGYWDLEKHRSRNLGSFSYYYEEFVQSQLQQLSQCYRTEHLVEAPTGETFIVKWYSDLLWGSEGNFGNPRWQRFMVFKIRYDQICTAVSTKDIGDLCIFLSTKGEPFSVKASLYGLNPNYIYYVGHFNFGKVNIRDNVWVGGHGFSPAPYFIPPQSS